VSLQRYENVAATNTEFTELSCATPSGFLSLLTFHSTTLRRALFHAPTIHGFLTFRDSPLSTAANVSQHWLPLMSLAWVGAETLPFYWPSGVTIERSVPNMPSVTRAPRPLLSWPLSSPGSTLTVSTDVSPHPSPLMGFSILTHTEVSASMLSL